MNKKVLALLLCGLPMIINAQDAFDVLQMSQSELRGTSRFQSMAGAFGALGGDLSVLTQNPGGIGVYRNSDLGLTLSLDCNSTKAGIDKMNQTKFNVNNIGYIGAIRLDSEAVPNLNFGFTYNRIHSYNRRYVGGVGDIHTSMSNFVASEFVNMQDIDPSELAWGNDYNPYFDGNAPWAAVTMFDMPSRSAGSSTEDGYVGIINANDDGYMMGLYGGGTTGDAYYEVEERGHADEYNIAFGGNFANKVYWGLDFGILDLDYRSYQAYEEELTDAYVMGDNKDLWTSPIVNQGTKAHWGLYNYLHSEGTGVNFKLGLIWRPIQQLRIGAAFHTPTFYDMRDTYRVDAMLTAYLKDGNDRYNELYRADNQSNDGYNYSSTYTISTPWHFLGSVAGVIGTSGIISLDYEYVANQTMRVGNDRGDNWPDVTYNVKNYFKPSHIIRLGAEYRLTPAWSLRAGYSYKTSQVKKDVDDRNCNIATVGSNPAYQYDNAVHNFTCGVGYHHKAFYADMAYVHKMRNSVYNAFSPIVDHDLYVNNLSADVTDHNNRISLTLGMRF